MALLDGGLLGGARQIAQEAGVPEATESDQGDAYRKPFGVNSFDTFGATLVDTDTEVELARVETPAALERRWGYGRADLPDNQGYHYAVLQNASGEQIHGELVYKWENATGRQSEVHDEADTKDMNTTDRYDREKQLPFPEKTSKNKASHNQYLTVYFTPSTPSADITNAYEIDAASSEVRWVATEYDLS